MDQVTQQNAALVEEAAAAAQSLQEQAAGLSQVVSVFRLDDRQQHDATPSRRTAASYQRPAPQQPPAAKRTIAAPTAKRDIAPLAPKPLNAAASAGASEWEEF
jgi:hypothetical protein